MGQEDVWKALFTVTITAIFLMIGILEKRKSKRLDAIEERQGKSVSREELNNTVKTIRIEIRQQSESSTLQWTELTKRLENIATAMREGQRDHNKQIENLYGVMLKNNTGG